ncbi:MAG: motility-associated protein [Anaerolineales bacterium]
MEHGDLKVLMQPAELIIIGGDAIGTALIGSPLHILKKIASGVAGVFGGSKFTRLPCRARPVPRASSCPACCARRPRDPRH